MPLDEALSRLAEVASGHRITQAEERPTAEALGRVLAADVVSAIDVPPADNSSMDGYALRVADVAQAGVVLPVSQRIPAGSVGIPLASGSAARIFTGAQLPAGADAVVMQELCEAVVGGVRIDTLPQPGQWIRRRGEDVRVGTAVLERGSRLSPQAQGLAAGVGAATLTVCRRPRVALFSTGDELVMPGARCRRARSQLQPLHLARAARSRRLQVTTFIVPDRLDATRGAAPRGIAHDLILTSGGVRSAKRTTSSRRCGRRAVDCGR
jgi:molybdopterin molybdotransferase